MSEWHLLYTFVALMVFNLAASMVYLVGLTPVKEAFRRRTTDQATPRPKS